MSKSTQNFIAGTAPQFFSVDEAAIILNVSKKMVYRWIKEGKLPAFRVDGSPRSTRISRAALEEFIQQYTTTIQQASQATAREEDVQGKASYDAERG